MFLSVVRRLVVDTRENVRVQRGQTEESCEESQEPRGQETKRPSGPKRVARMAEVV